MVNAKQITGREGEEAALVHLKDRFYDICEQNFRCHYGEIDIIARKDDILCFVEVKTRRHESHGSPAEAVTRNKQRRIIKTAMHYLQENDPDYEEIRFDVVTIDFDLNDEMVVDLIEGAFEVN